MHSQPVFYDFEASGLAGFPIEIGWAWLDGDIVKSDSLLIAPADDWDAAGNWDGRAEKIHGISVVQLKIEGQSAVLVADRLNHCLAGRTLYSDSPFDLKWMAQLFAAAGLVPEFKVHRMPAAELVDDARRRLGLSLEDATVIAGNVSKKFPHIHQARTDALYWAELWAAISRGAALERQVTADFHPEPGIAAMDQGNQMVALRAR